MRSPAELDRLIDRHREVFGQDPLLIAISPTFRAANLRYFAAKTYGLCCSKGLLYRGIPLIYSSSPMIEDFLISY